MNAVDGESVPAMSGVGGSKLIVGVYVGIGVVPLFIKPVGVFDVWFDGLVDEL